MMSVDAAIWKKFQVRRRDNLPFNASGTRTHLIVLFAELGFKKGAEIGVCRGEFSAVMLKTIPDLELFCVDNWQPYSLIRSENRQDLYHQQAVANLSRFPGAKILWMDSVEASRQIPDASLDFVYIDGAHDFDHVMADMLHWIPKVKHDGIIAGHDYPIEPGVATAVNAYVKGCNITSWYVTREVKPPSWFWVNQRQ